ncbi:MAG TPA: DUF2272 domain-containing protein, partial [Thermoanaerobaculia bacterium]
MTTKCAFHRADKTFVELSDLRRAVVDEAIAEEKFWFDPAKKTHRQEHEDAQFGRLVSYWLGGIDSTIHPGKLEALQNAALGPGITYGNLTDTALNAAIKSFNDADAVAEAKEAEVYEQSFRVDVAKATLDVARKDRANARDGLKAAERQLAQARKQSGTGAQALVEESQRVLDGAKLLAGSAEGLVKLWSRMHEGAKRELTEARAAHTSAVAARRALEAAAEAWKSDDRTNVRKALITKAAGSDPQPVATKVGEALQAAHNSRADSEAWSAAFVSAVVRSVALKLKLERMIGGRPSGQNALLLTSRAHWKYVKAALTSKSGRYQAFDPRAHAVEPGDLIATYRKEFKERRIPLTAAGVHEQLLHVDIVVAVEQAKFAEAIGGNVGHSVRRRRYPLDAAGKLVVERDKLYVTRRDDGTFPPFGTTAYKTMLHPASTGRIVALLRLVPQCKTIEEGFLMSRFDSFAGESPFLESEVLTAEELEPRYELRGIESPFLAAELEQRFVELEEEESWSEEAEEPPSAGSDGVIAFDAQTLPMRVAVLVTQAARQAREVDVLLFAHGLDVCGPVLKNRPVTFITERPFRLGQLVESSGRPIVLVVPFLDWERMAKNKLSFGHKWHKLAQPKNLNGVIAEALEKANVPSVGRLIVAGHSRAFGIFDALARLHADPEMSSGALAKLTHVWALDSTYTSPVADWMKWLDSRSDLRMTVIYRHGTFWSKKTNSREPLSTGVHGKRFLTRAKESGGRMTVIPVAAGKVGHCAIPGHYLPDLLSSLSGSSAQAEELSYLDEELYADDRLDAGEELYEYEEESDAELFETQESLEQAAEESFDQEGEEELDEEIDEELDEEIDEEAEDEFVGEVDEEAAAAAVVVFPSGESLPIVTGLPDAKGEDYWDPSGSTNPLLDTGPAHKDKRLSTHFSVRELTKTGGASADVARIDPKLVECLQRIRDHVDKPVTITSGYRSWKRNKQVYAAMKDADGKPRKPTLSQHCGGRAVDIAIAGMNGLAIGRAAVEACGPDIGIGLGNTFAHIDVRGAAVAWNYGGAKDSWVAEIKQLQRNAPKGVTSPPPQRSSTAPAVVPHKSTMSDAERRKHIAAAIDQAKTAGTSADRASIASTLKANGTDLDTWFGGMVPDATFLGRAIRASGGRAPGVHRALFEALQRAERTLLDQYPGRTAEQLGKELGIYDIAGLRPPRKATGGTLPSYHCFGLAIDINHDTNPFVGNMKPKKDSARYEEFMANRSPRVIERAMWLLRGERFDVEKAIAGSPGAVWDVHHRASDTLAEYLRLADEGGGAKLQSLVTKAQANGDSKTLAWW